MALGPSIGRPWVEGSGQIALNGFPLVAAAAVLAASVRGHGVRRWRPEPAREIRASELLT